LLYLVPSGDIGTKRGDVVSTPLGLVALPCWN
jgi:hypothetical protein